MGKKCLLFSLLYLLFSHMLIIQSVMPNFLSDMPKTLCFTNIILFLTSTFLCDPLII